MQALVSTRGRGKVRRQKHYQLAVRSCGQAKRNLLVAEPSIGRVVEVAHATSAVHYRMAGPPMREYWAFALQLGDEFTDIRVARMGSDICTKFRHHTTGPLFPVNHQLAR